MAKDHDKLDTLDATRKAIAWELARYARRMKEVAEKVVDAEVSKAIEEGKAINALEISEIAVNAAKAQFAQGVRAALPAPARRRLAKR
jgi:hypothetical protein